MDTNNDGRLSHSEIRRARAAAGKSPAPGARRFEMLDRNDDGAVILIEIRARVTQKIAAIDANGDCGVTKAEFAAHRRSR